MRILTFKAMVIVAVITITIGLAGLALLNHRQAWRPDEPRLSGVAGGQPDATPGLSGFDKRVFQAAIAALCVEQGFSNEAAGLSESAGRIVEAFWTADADGLAAVYDEAGLEHPGELIGPIRKYKMSTSTRLFSGVPVGQPELHVGRLPSVKSALASTRPDGVSLNTKARWKPRGPHDPIGRADHEVVYASVRVPAVLRNEGGKHEYYHGALTIIFAKVVPDGPWIHVALEREVPATIVGDVVSNALPPV